MGLLSDCLTFQEELRGLLFDGSNLEKEDPNLFDYISGMENPKGVLEHSKKFKEEGNISFKKGDFDGALEKYSLSCVFLSCLVFREGDDRFSFSQLATSVVLNMAASLLKKEFRQVGHLCTIILNHNPAIVKALFRRANAVIGLGKYELACWDLKVAYEVESSNLEVVEKLKEVEQTLHTLKGNIHEQEKNKQEGYLSEESSYDPMGKGVDTSQNGKEIVNCNDIDHYTTMEVEGSDEKCNEEVTVPTMGKPRTKDEEMSERVEKNDVRKKWSGSTPKVGERFQFRNRKKPESAAISKRDYHLLVKVRIIQHFNPRTGIAMSIRVIDNTKEILKVFSESQTQHISHSSLVHQGDHYHHKTFADNINRGSVLDKDERSIPMETFLPEYEEVKMDQPTDIALIPPFIPSHDIPLDQSPACFQSITTGNRRFLFHSITSANCSPTRRISNRFRRKKGSKERGVKHKNSIIVLYNHVFQCRYKVEVTTKDSDHLQPSSQNISSYCSGKKRKATVL